MSRVRFYAWRLDPRWLVLAVLMAAIAVGVLLSVRASTQAPSPPVMYMPRTTAAFSPSTFVLMQKPGPNGY